jgi:hypothetical protein
MLQFFIAVFRCSVTAQIVARLFVPFCQQAAHVESEGLSRLTGVPRHGLVDVVEDLFFDPSLLHEDVVHGEPLKVGQPIMRALALFRTRQQGFKNATLSRGQVIENDVPCFLIADEGGETIVHFAESALELLEAGMAGIVHHPVAT